MMIYTEEDMFKKSFAVAIGLEEPVPLARGFQDPEDYQIANDQFT